MTTPPTILTYIKEKDIDPKWWVMAIMFAIILLMATCEPVKRAIMPCPVCPEITTVTPPDTSPINAISDIPEPEVVYLDSIIYKDTTIYKDRWHTLYRDTGRIDTVFIIRDWFAFRMYADTLRNDSSAFIAVYDTISQNKLLGRSYAFQNRRGDNIVEVEKDLRLRIFAGGFVGGNKVGAFEAGLSLMAVPKNDNFYVQYSYDAVGNSHRAGVGWKIKFRR